MQTKEIVKRCIRFILGGIPIIKVSPKIVTLNSNSTLYGKVALITGGTSGIGYAIAKAFVNAGAEVVITGRDKERNSKAVDKLKNETSKGCIYSIVLNNTDVNGLKKGHDDAIKMVGKSIDILVNNAGVNCLPMPNATEDEYDKVMDTNLKGTFFLSQLFGKYMIENKIKGNILNIASASSLRPADSAYTLSKWGIRALTLGLAKSLGKYGITVNGIAPGPTATPMMIKDSDTNIYLDRIPLGRYVMPEEIASMAVILVSDMGRSIMGDLVYMTGGAGVLTYDDVPYLF